MKSISLVKPKSARGRLSLKWLLLLLALTGAPIAAQAQAQASAPAQGGEQAPQGGGIDLPEADKQAIQKYTLTEDVFNRMIAATKEARAANIKPAQPDGDPSKIHSLDDLAKQAVGTDPRIAPLIKKHGFTPREFMLANIALMNAAITVQAQSQPNAMQVDESRVNQANVEFFKQHQAQIQALMQGGG